MTFEQGSKCIDCRWIHRVYICPLNGEACKHYDEYLHKNKDKQAQKVAEKFMENDRELE